MNDEREFLHKISNSLAIAKLSLELLRESEEDSQRNDPQRQQQWERAVNALAALQDSIVARRGK